MAYQVLLRREPDPGAWVQYTEALEARLLTREELVERIRCSSEFRTGVRLHGSALARRRCTPAAPSSSSACPGHVGSSTWEAAHQPDERGALVTLGYPYDFDELVIVDLPPDDRHPLYASERYLVGGSPSAAG